MYVTLTSWGKLVLISQWVRKLKNIWSLRHTIKTSQMKGAGFLAILAFTSHFEK